MAECYYSYSFDLEDGLIMEEILGKHVVSPMRAVGCKPPLDFDDYIDIWKSLCYPVFKNEEDEDRLTRRHFQEAYARGERFLFVELEHNPLKNTYAAKYTRVNIKLYEDEKTGRARAHVMWEENPELAEGQDPTEFKQPR